VKGLILFFFLFLLNFSFSQNGIYDQYYSLEHPYEKKNNLDSLKTIFDNHLSKAVELNDTIEQLKVLRWKYWYLSNEIDQGKILNQLKTISKALNNKREVAVNYYTIGSKEYNKGDYLNALTLFEESLDAAIAANWNNGMIDNILAITGIYRETNSQQDINPFLENTLSDLNKYYPDNRNTNKYWICLEIAKNYLDENNLSHIFNKKMGVSFSEYISRCRVEYLISEVRETPELISNKSSIQLAEMADFMSIDAYTSAFKRHEGKTPRQYFIEIV